MRKSWPRSANVAGIQPQTLVWAPGTGPQPAKNWSGHGRPPKLLRRDGKHQPISVKKLAIGLPPHAWRKITWREATAEPLSSRFARVRVRAAHRDYWLVESRPEEWLLIEWPEGEEVPPNIGSQRFRRTLRSVSSSTPLSCVGALSAITKNSNRRLASATSKGEAGAASTITQRCASRRTDSWSPSGRRFPPQEQVPPGCSKKFQSPKLTARGVPPAA